LACLFAARQSFVFVFWGTGNKATPAAPAACFIGHPITHRSASEHELAMGWLCQPQKDISKWTWKVSVLTWDIMMTSWDYVDIISSFRMSG